MIYPENRKHIIMRQHFYVLLLVRLSHKRKAFHPLASKLIWIQSFFPWHNYIRWLLYTLSTIHAHRRSSAEQQSHKLSYGSH